MADDRRDVLRAEERRRAALVAVDMATLDALFADDLIHVHSTGLIHDKAQLLRHIEANRAFLAIERGDLAVRLYGDIAIMTGPMTNRMRRGSDGTALLDGTVTQVLRRQGGEAWRFVSFHFTLGKG